MSHSISAEFLTISALIVSFIVMWLLAIAYFAWQARKLPHLRRRREGFWNLIPMAVSAVGGLIAKKKQDAAAKQAGKAAAASQVNPEEVARIARDQAVRNARESLALEGALTPENQAFRNESMRALLAQLRGGTPYADLAMSTVAGNLAAPIEAADRSALLTDAIDRARQDLALGGELDTATRNEVTRRAAGTAARVGGGRLGMGANVTARDLGLRSLDLANQRLATGGQFGGFEQSLNQQDLLNLLNQRQQQSQLATVLQNMEGARTNRYSNLAGFGQQLQAPSVGLSTADLVNLYTNNATNKATAIQNAAALKAQSAKSLGSVFGSVGALAGGLGGQIFGGGTGDPSNISGILNPSGNSNSGGLWDQ